MSSVTSRFAPWPFPRNVSAGFVSQVPTVATITCEAVDADGRTATAEVCLPIGSGGCG